MTETQLRASVVKTAERWLGAKESNGSHKEIIDIYNAKKPLARGYKVKYTDEWCATFVSAVFILSGLTDIAPTECSCSRMIDLYKKLGSWKESDAYTPKPGDLVMYDWEDKGVGDNVGAPNHVGMVVSVTGKTIKVIEGNKAEAVGYRTLKVNGKYIRGYCAPNYAKKATKNVVKSMTVSLPILKKGSEGIAVTSLQQLLTAKGFDTKGIDGSFGSDTDAAFRAFQRAAGLREDGSCGKDSWTALLTSYK